MTAPSPQRLVQGLDRWQGDPRTARAHQDRRDGQGVLAVGEGPDVLTLPASGPEGFEPGAVLEALSAGGLRRVLVEGGGVTVSRFLEAGLLDRLHLTVAPMLMGSGRPGITLPPIETPDQSLRARCRHVPLGDDLLFDLDLS